MLNGSFEFALCFQRCFKRHISPFLGFDFIWSEYPHSAVLLFDCAVVDAIMLPMDFDAGLSHLGRDASLVVDSAVEGFPYEATVATYALDECLRVDALYALWKDLNLHFDVLVLHLMERIICGFEVQIKRRIQIF